MSPKLVRSPTLMLIPRNRKVASVVTLGDDTTIMVDGNPFFPLGFYINPNGSLAQQTSEMLTVAAAGYNTIHANIGGMGLTNFLTFLDTANSVGIEVIAEFDLSQIPTYVGQLKSKPAMLAYDIADDVDNGQHTKAEVARLYQQVHASDPDHLAFIAAGHYTSQPQPNVGTFVTTTDIIGMQTDPISNEPIYVSAYAIANAHDAGLPSGRPVVAINQAFAFAGDRPPTPEEERVMTYQSLTMGAKGIVYYSYDDSAPIPQLSPPLWTELNALGAEINGLAPVLQSGQRFDLLRQFNNNADYASYWRYNGQVYVVISNSSPTRTNTESLALPADVVGDAWPLFDRYPASMHFANGRLSGSIAPQGVQVYVLDTGSATPAWVMPVDGTASQITLPGADFPVPLAAWVGDTNGNGVVGTTVTFAVAPAGQGWATFADGTELATAVTDANGIATAPMLTAGTPTGDFTMEAQVDGVNPPAVYTLTVDAGATPAVRRTTATTRSAPKPLSGATTKPMATAPKSMAGSTPTPTVGKGGSPTSTGRSVVPVKRP